jgi:hypothetical protein
MLTSLLDDNMRLSPSKLCQTDIGHSTHAVRAAYIAFLDCSNEGILLVSESGCMLVSQRIELQERTLVNMSG